MSLNLATVILMGLIVAGVLVHGLIAHCQMIREPIAKDALARMFGPEDERVLIRRDLPTLLGRQLYALVAGVLAIVLMGQVCLYFSVQAYLWVLAMLLLANWLLPVMMGWVRYQWVREQLKD